MLQEFINALEFISPVNICKNNDKTHGVIPNKNILKYRFSKEAR